MAINEEKYINILIEYIAVLNKTIELKQDKINLLKEENKRLEDIIQLFSECEIWQVKF